MFSSRREDVEYVRRRAHHLLAHAEPLMKIYRETDTARFEHFMQKEEERRRSGDGVRIGEDMFSNMSIVCYGDKQVVILKENDPRIAFVIYHPTPYATSIRPTAYKGIPCLVSICDKCPSIHVAAWRMLVHDELNRCGRLA